MFNKCNLFFYKYIMKKILKDLFTWSWRWNRFKFWIYPFAWIGISLILLLIIFILSSLINYWTQSLLSENIIPNANALSFWNTKVEELPIQSADIVIQSIIFYVTSFLYLLAILIPTIWLSIWAYIKRLHDLDKSGWMSLLMIVPLANIYLFIICGFFKWTEWTNKYGPNPLI